MKKIVVKASTKAPYILLDPDKGLIEIKGRSIPEDIDSTYTPLIDWVEKYLENPRGKTTVNFNLEYMNSSTTKILMRLINILMVASRLRKTILEINWSYSDDDMLEHGEDFEDLSGLKFNFIFVE